jgi:hypothetical protein
MAGFLFSPANKVVKVYTMEHEKTNRGFDIYLRLTDTYRNEIRVQESSNVDPAVWIFTHGPNGKDGTLVKDSEGENWQSFSPHLSPEQARVVGKALLQFADDFLPLEDKEPQ